MVKQPEMEERRKLAEGLVLEAESLTADLEDDEAKVLLDWGLTEAQVAAEATRDLEDADQARRIIEDAVAHLRRAMKKVNEDVAEQADLEASARLAKVQSLVADQAQSFSVLNFIEVGKEAPTEEIKPAPPTEEVAPAKERPQTGGLMARIRSWLGLD
jgi:hypothetical protein